MKEKKSHLNLWIYVIITICILSSSIAYSALNASVKITGDVVIEKPKGSSLYDEIKKNVVMDNIKSTYVSSETGIDFSQISSDTNGKGIYELNTTRDDEHPIYYYRGAVADNNIIFAGFCWKIIRTTETGGIKIIYNGSSTNDNKCTNTTGEITQIRKSAYNSSSNDDKYVGYKYDNDTIDSTIKTNIDAWYKTNINEKLDKSGKSYTTYIEDLEFCNDRREYSCTLPNCYEPKQRNFENRTPSLECSQEDKFTVVSEKLTYPVGLITIDEAAYAGGVQYTDNNSYYLYTGKHYWTMSPLDFDGICANILGVSPAGAISYYYAWDNSTGIRPVVNLLPNTQVTGLGTSDSPYIIVE